MSQLSAVGITGPRAGEDVKNACFFAEVVPATASGDLIGS